MVVQDSDEVVHDECYRQQKASKYYTTTGCGLDQYASELTFGSAT